MTATLVSVLFHGLAYAMVLYIATVGLSITMGLMRFANLAHGVFAMAGGYVLTRTTGAWGVPFEVGLVLAFVVVAAASMVLERLVYRPLYQGAELRQVLLSISLIFISMGAAKFFFGPMAESLTLPAYLSGQIEVAGRAFPAYRIFLIVVGMLVIAALWLTIDRTEFGAKVRASVDSRMMAEALGINTDRLFMLTFALGSGLAGLGGALGADVLPINPAYPLHHLVLFLMVVAIGGLGSIRGAFYAALFIGLGDTASKILVPQLGNSVLYLAILVLLLMRPQGMIGRSAS